MKNSTAQPFWHAFVLVFKNKGYFVLALLSAGAIFALGLLLPSYSLLKWTFFFSGFSLLDKFYMLGLSLKSVITLNSTIISLTLLFVISFLSGVNITLLIFYFRLKTKIASSAGASLLGWGSAFLGIGCTACGAIILPSVFGLMAATKFIGALPLQGLEFGLLAVGLLTLSIVVLAIKIQGLFPDRKGI